jgi:hypothetical protein
MPRDATVESQQALLESLVEAYVAFQELKELANSVGEFVVLSRIQAQSSEKNACGEDRLHRKRTRCEITHVGDIKCDKGKKEEEEALSDDSSAKRMALIYEHLKETQILFEEEMEKFIDETEENCRLGDAAPQASSE